MRLPPPRTESLLRHPFHQVRREIPDIPIILRRARIQNQKSGMWSGFEQLLVTLRVAPAAAVTLVVFGLP